MSKKALSLTAALTVCLCLSGVPARAQSQDTTLPHKLHFRNAPPIMHGDTTAEARRSIVTNAAAAGTNLLPVFNYQVVSSRDGRRYQGVRVGANPSTRGAAAQVNVRAQLIPVILKFHRIGTAVDLKTGVITMASGDATSDPIMPDTGCFTGAANVTSTLAAPV